MDRFLGTHQSRLDIKGRISVPASFRAVLRDLGETEIVLRPSHKHPCIEAWPPRAFAELEKALATLDVFSDDHDALQSALYADACSAEPDKEGRIVLPDHLKQHATLSDAVAFIGKGSIFQIWDPAAGARNTADGKQRASLRSLTVPGRPMQ